MRRSSTLPWKNSVFPGSAPTWTLVTVQSWAAAVELPAMTPSMTRLWVLPSKV
jgi:hypothetical protein